MPAPNLVASDAHPNFLLDTRSYPCAALEAMIVPFAKITANYLLVSNGGRFYLAYCFEAFSTDVFLTYAFLFLD